MLYSRPRFAPLLHLFLNANKITSVCKRRMHKWRNETKHTHTQIKKKLNVPSQYANYFWFMFITNIFKTDTRFSGLLLRTKQNNKTQTQKRQHAATENKNNLRRKKLRPNSGHITYESRYTLHTSEKTQWWRTRVESTAHTSCSCPCMLNTFPATFFFLQLSEFSPTR